MLVVGQKEADEGTVSIRLRNGKQMPPMSVEAFGEFLCGKIAGRDLEI
jgi:threonyl-tRNA synthetase